MLVILGAGGYGNTVADIALQLGYDIVQLDDADTAHPLNSFARYIGDGVSFIPAFGNNAFRLEWIDRLKAAGVGNVIIKCGKRGCYIRTDEEARWMSAVKGAHCIDTTGAGDSFVAGFLCALLEGKNVIECAENGGICGAKAVEVMGATEWI